MTWPSLAPECCSSGRGMEVTLGCGRPQSRNSRQGWRPHHRNGLTHTPIATGSLRSISRTVVCRDFNGNNGVHTPPSLGDVAGSELVWTKFVAETLLPTKQGKFRLRGYRHTTDNGTTYTEPSAIISGVVEGQENVLVRVHDACFTSEVLGSLKCDCREQLELALDVIQDAPPGMVIYLQQEGRGIGLANKIAAYALQEKGLDTVDANRALGLPDDCREYTAVRHILNELGIKSIRLMTNNPRKMSEMAGLGINVVGREPCIIKAQKFNVGYLKSKAQRMSHMLHNEEPVELELDGSFCFWNHEGELGSAGIPLEPVMVPGEGEGAWLNGAMPKHDGALGKDSEEVE